MRRVIRLHIAMLRILSAFLLLLLAAAPARAGVSEFCLGGPCVLSDPTVVNVYWDASPTQWDTDIGGPSTGLTQMQLDAFSSALAHSSYFSQLTQYGVNSVTVLPGVTAGSCAPLPADVDTAINTIDSLIRCALTNPRLAGASQLVFNVFLPPQVINTGFCNRLPDGTHNAAMHGKSAAIYTIIPTTAACIGISVAGVTTSVTHELVEAFTDPDGTTGWGIPFSSEIGDLCEVVGTFPTTRLVFGRTQQYWSNSANACVVGFSPPRTAPVVTSTSVCGTGRDMKFVLNGSFGPRPWDLAANQFLGQTLYLRATIKIGSQVWTAGNFLGAPPDTVSFRGVEWIPGGGPGGSDQIKVSGFGAAYGTAGKFVTPGSTITFTIENPLSAVRTTADVVAPGVARIVLSAAPDINAGDTGGLTATAVDSGNCSVENAQLAFTGAPGVAGPLTTGPDGMVAASILYPNVAGPLTMSAAVAPVTPSSVTASVTTRVHPRLDVLAPARGAVAGGQITVLSGLGFDASTTVKLGGNAATVQGVSTDHKHVTLRTPASTLAGGVGPVAIDATVNGVEAFALQYDYIQPDVPVLEFLGAGGAGSTTHTCSSGLIRVSAFDTTGALEVTSIALSAGYPAFRSGLHPVNAITVQSGSTVTIFGGGPITATNTRSPNAVTTESFPVWPAELCDALNFINAKIKQFRAIAGPYTAFQPPCTGDCGEHGMQRVFWGDAKEAGGVKNLVWMEGSDAGALERAYEVIRLADDAQRALVAKNPVVAVRSPAATSASFVGAMIDIRPRAGAEAPVPMAAGAHISLALPHAAAPDAYAIVHLRPEGGRLAWVEDTKSAVMRDATAITTIGESSGVYALVELAPKAKQPRR